MQQGGLSSSCCFGFAERAGHASSGHGGCLTLRDLCRREQPGCSTTAHVRPGQCHARTACLCLLLAPAAITSYYLLYGESSGEVVEQPSTAPGVPQQRHTNGTVTHRSGNPQPALTCKVTTAHQRRAAKGFGELKQVSGMAWRLSSIKATACSSISYPLLSPPASLPTGHQLLTVHSN